MEHKPLKHILCYGDSNTFGSDPDHPGQRHPYQVRWTGRLQHLLGEDYRVIEEGMGGRNTVWDDPLEDNRNGLRFLPVALQSHKPLDLVILALGTNDCKSHLPANAATSTLGMARLIDTMRRFDYGPVMSAPQILLLAPIHIGTEIAHSSFTMFDDASRAMSMELGPRYRALAESCGCAFLDAAAVAGPGADQLHMASDGHQAVAEALAPMIRGLL